jgi:pyruvate formate lyase activating enzyme
VYSRNQKLQKNGDEFEALVFDIKRDCSEDGPGIRTTVFFKGCPLSCVWCHNPEGISFKPSISFSIDRCAPAKCGGYACLEVCPSNVLKINDEDKKIKVNHAACTRCDKCFEVCVPKALEPVGTWWKVKKLLTRVLVDQNFFQSTGGGVTLSGGEPTLQVEFVHKFLVGLKKKDVKVGLETSGMFHLKKFLKYILPYLDFIYFDLKLIHPADSYKFTGWSNEDIIKNFLFLHTQSDTPMVTRIPLIPDITATEKNLKGLAQFLKKHRVTACSLMPYNPMWQDKAAKNGIDIKYSRFEFMSQKEEENCVQYFLSE